MTRDPYGPVRHACDSWFLSLSFTCVLRIQAILDRSCETDVES